MLQTSTYENQQNFGNPDCRKIIPVFYITNKLRILIFSKTRRSSIQNSQNLDHSAKPLNFLHNQQASYSKPKRPCLEFPKVLCSQFPITTVQTFSHYINSKQNFKATICTAKYVCFPICSRLKLCIIQNSKSTWLETSKHPA